MANMTLSIPDEVHEKMKAFPEIKWSHVARNSIIERLERMEKWEEVERIAQKSKLTQKDADEIAKKIKKGSTERFLKEIGRLQ